MLKVEQIKEAVAQMISYCEDIEQTNYHSVSARGVLYTLGYTPEDAEQILPLLAADGFEYCLDPAVECNSGDPDNPGRIHPPEFACYWGPDQLKSRLLFCFKYRPQHYHA
jgi:hypothetical protein